MTRRVATVLALLALTFAGPNPAQAWGASGHRMVGVAAMESLPPDLPAFLRSPAAKEWTEPTRTPEQTARSS